MAVASKRRPVATPVIADAGPLIALAKVGRLALLKALFGCVQLTPEVVAELAIDGSGADAPTLQEALSEGWLAALSADTPAALHPFLDIGEASCLAYAATHARTLLIIDEKLGRREAHRLRIAITGTASVLCAAKTRGLIDAVVPVLEEMREKGYFLGEKVIDAARAQAGE